MNTIFSHCFLSSSLEENQNKSLGLCYSFLPSQPTYPLIVGNFCSAHRWNKTIVTSIFCPLGNEFHNYRESWTVCYLEKTRLWGIETKQIFKQSVARSYQAWTSQFSRPVLLKRCSKGPFKKYILPLMDQKRVLQHMTTTYTSSGEFNSNWIILYSALQ